MVKNENRFHIDAVYLTSSLLSKWSHIIINHTQGGKQTKTQNETFTEQQQQHQI